MEYAIDLFDHALAHGSAVVPTGIEVRGVERKTGRNEELCRADAAKRTLKCVKAERKHRADGERADRADKPNANRPALGKQHRCAAPKEQQYFPNPVNMQGLIGSAACKEGVQEPAFGAGLNFHWRSFTRMIGSILP